MDLDLEELLDEVDRPDADTDAKSDEDDEPHTYPAGEAQGEDYYASIRWMQKDEAAEAVVKIFVDQLRRRRHLARFLLEEGGLNIIDWWEEQGRNYSPELEQIAKVQKSIKHSLQFLTGPSEATHGTRRREAAANSIVEGVKTLVQLFQAGNQHLRQQQQASAAQVLVPSPSVDGADQGLRRSPRVAGLPAEAPAPQPMAKSPKPKPEEAAGMGAPFREGARAKLVAHHQDVAKHNASSDNIVRLVHKLVGDGGV